MTFASRQAYVFFKLYHAWNSTVIGVHKTLHFVQQQIRIISLVVKFQSFNSKNVSGSSGDPPANPEKAGTRS